MDALLDFMDQVSTPAALGWNSHQLGLEAFSACVNLREVRLHSCESIQNIETAANGIWNRSVLICSSASLVRAAGPPSAPAEGVKLIDLAAARLRKQIANFADGSDERGQTLLKQQMADLRYPRVHRNPHVSQRNASVKRLLKLSQRVRPEAPRVQGGRGLQILIPAALLVHPGGCRSCRKPCVRLYLRSITAIGQTIDLLTPGGLEWKQIANFAVRAC